jgi:hypothetical protein
MVSLQPAATAASIALTSFAGVAGLRSSSVVQAQTTAAAPKQSPAQMKASAKTWKVSRTPWGDPDLQGIWNTATATPLERPSKFGGTPVLTDEEAAEFQEEVASNLTRDRRDGSQEVDVDRAYNEHWMDARRLQTLQDKRTSLIVDPPDGRLPPAPQLTPERRKAAEERAARVRPFYVDRPNGPQELPLVTRCILREGHDRAPYLGTIYNNTNQIFQSPGYVTILSEMVHHARIIPLTGPHVGPDLRQWLGDARGRWEGETLVVETTNFRRDPGLLFGNANPDTFQIVERFTRLGPDTLKYEFTISDPDTWTRPWIAMVSWSRIEEQLYEYTCHEDNYDMAHFLAAAQTREAKGREANQTPPTPRP